MKKYSTDLSRVLLFPGHCITFHSRARSSPHVERDRVIGVEENRAFLRSRYKRAIGLPGRFFAPSAELRAKTQTQSRAAPRNDDDGR